MSKPIVTDADVRKFVDDGFVVVERLLSDEEVVELRNEAIAIARGKYPAPQLRPVPADLDDDAAMRQILCIHQPHGISPVIRKYVSHPRATAVLGRLVGAHLPHWDGRVKCMQSMLFVKGPGEPGQAWHQDEIFIPTRDRSLCGCWLALDDATVANGCLWILPGSHRSGYLWPQRSHDKSGEFDFADESYGFDDGAELPVTLPAGGAVFFNGYLLHRSKKNRSDGYRRALVNHYMNAYSLLPWGNDAGQNFATADNRAVVPVVGADPYEWKGTVTRDDVWLRPRTEK